METKRIELDFYLLFVDKGNTTNFLNVFEIFVLYFSILLNKHGKGHFYFEYIYLKSIW